MGWIIVLIVLLAGYVCYVISLRVHPFRGCPACSGTGRHRGSFFTYSHRRCRRCGGTGRQNRQGVQWGWGGSREQLPGKGRGGA
jgi:DnaJ-class molecular chaperone